MLDFFGKKKIGYNIETYTEMLARNVPFFLFIFFVVVVDDVDDQGGGYVPH